MCVCPCLNLQLDSFFFFICLHFKDIKKMCFFFPNLFVMFQCFSCLLNSVSLAAFAPHSNFSIQAYLLVKCAVNFACARIHIKLAVFLFACFFFFTLFNCTNLNPFQTAIITFAINLHTRNAQSHTLRKFSDKQHTKRGAKKPIRGP